MAEATRREVLGLYRRVFRLARRWQAASGRGEDTAEEQQYILHEARTLFRKNRDVSGPRGFGAVPVSPWSVLSTSPPPWSSPTRLCLLLGPVFLCAPAQGAGSPEDPARACGPGSSPLPAQAAPAGLRAWPPRPPQCRHSLGRRPRATAGHTPPGLGPPSTSECKGGSPHPGHSRFPSSAPRASLPCGASLLGRRLSRRLGLW